MQKSLFGGDGGIRTLDTGLSPYAPLAGEYLQPLGHVSEPPRIVAECAAESHLGRPFKYSTGPRRGFPGWDARSVVKRRVVPFASGATKQTAREATSRRVCTIKACLRRCGPRHRGSTTTFGPRLASRPFSYKRGSRRVLKRPAKRWPCRVRRPDAGRARRVPCICPRPPPRS
jgi:hypothetical protein